MQREQQIKSGALLEVSFYPIFESGRRMPSRAPKEKRSTPEQAAYNYKQSVKKVVRLVNANFNNSDIFLHLTFSAGNVPASEDEARKHIKNYVRKIRRRRAQELKKVVKVLEAMPKVEALAEERARLAEKKKKLSEPLRYIYTIEKTEYKSGKRAGTANYHFHGFVTGGLSRGELEKMWQHGGINADRFQPETFGHEAAARYIMKDPQGRKRFSFSKNLKQPKRMKPKDGKTSRRAVAKMATERADDRTYWERRYTGYSFVRCESVFNPYNGYYYVNVVMFKKRI